MTERKAKTLDFQSKLLLWLELNRLHKFPVGTDLMFWPCAWGLAMASYHKSLPFNVFLHGLMIYAFAATLMHSTACVLNDIYDRDLDAQERTKNRPLACGAISLKAAVFCLVIQVFLCLAILAYMRDFFQFTIGFIGLFPLHGLYPLMKRYTHWPQAWLGFAMNWGFVVAWVHLVPEDTTYMVPATFLAGTICWTIVYDTIYACQDRVDDIKAGIRSTAVLFGDHVRPILAVFAIAFVVAVTFAGVLNKQGPFYYIVTVGATALHLLWQLITLKPEVPADCYYKFKANGHLGYIMFAGVTVDYLLKA